MSQSEPSYYTVGPLTEIHWGSLSLPTYYLIISLTYCLCVLWFYKRCESRQLPQKNAMDISLILMIFGFIGGRLGHVLFEYPEFYLKNPWQIFYFWQGGFVFYGGALLAYLMAALSIRKMKMTFWLWHDTLAPVIAFGYALGRLACFFAGCCYGKVCNLPWALPLKQVDLQTGLTQTLLRHPTPLYAAFYEFAVVIFLLWYEKQKPQLGRVFLNWVALHSIGRILMETFRDDPRGIQFFNLSISTFISLILLMSSLLWIYKLKKNLK